jgi:hypothetical protein
MRLNTNDTKFFIAFLACSCFKDGVSFAAGEAPVGFQTPNNVGQRQWLDAVMVFTDTNITGTPGTKAVVVSFRATVASLNPYQWLSNLGECGVGAAMQGQAVDGVADVGRVCDGYLKPVNDLISLGLMQVVKTRLAAMAPADRTVFISGHSRGGALVSWVGWVVEKASQLISLMREANGSWWPCCS